MRGEAERIAGWLVTTRMTRLLALAAALLVLGSSSVSAQRRGRWREPRRPPPISIDALQQVTAACQSAFEGYDNEQACMATVHQSGTRFAVGPIVAACESAFDGDDNELACVALSVGAWQEPSAAIAACESAFDGDDNELRCVGTLAGSWLSASAVLACEGAFDGDDNEQRCLEMLVGTRYEPAELVRYCESSFDGDDNELACLAQYR